MSAEYYKTDPDNDIPIPEPEENGEFIEIDEDDGWENE